MGDQPVRVATWNQQAWGTENHGARAAVTLGAGVDLLCAQELSHSRFHGLQDALGAGWWGVHSLSARTDLPPAGSYWGVAMFGRRDRTRPHPDMAADVVGDPEDDSDTGLFWRRTLHVPLMVDDAWVLHTASIHVRPGERVKEQKLQFVQRIGQWFEEGRRPLVVGVDANAPGLAEGGGEYFWNVEQDVWGPNPRHGLRDLWREKPGPGPEYTHILPSGPRRFDHLWASAELMGGPVIHLYDEAIASGSDHALVACDLTLTQRYHDSPRRHS